MTYLRFIIENARWLVVGFLLTLTSSYGQTYFISIFAADIRTEFDLSHGSWGAIYSLGTTASAVVMVWAGVLTDHFRVRVLAPIILVGLALACLSMSVVPNAALLVVVIFLLRFTGQGMTSQIAMVGMARWFQATRGRALSIASLGFALGQAILPLIFVAIMTMIGWRQSWVVAAGLAVVLIPLLLWCLGQERTPQSIASSTSAVGMGGQMWTRGALLKHWLFWMCVPLLLGPPAWGTALFFQQVHLAEVKGWSLVEYVSLYPWLTLTSVAATFLAGMGVDKYGAGRSLPLMPLPFLFGFVVISFSTVPAIAGVGLMIVGLGMGMQGTVVGAFWAEHYGTRYIGSIKSAATAVMVFGSAIGPGVSGYLIDLGVPFTTQMLGYAVYFGVTSALAAVAVLRARSLLPVAA
ncbi:MFS transporter [Celeribacter marinus]|uniref:MFS transporter n=1 Tax=Celeribacter marinus TaxID=1397108 RepID=UPI003F6D550D